MKQVISFIFLAFFTLHLAAGNGPTQIALEHKGVNHGGEHYDPIDIPEVYYDDDNQEIVIEADGFSSFYYVDIVSTSTHLLVYYTTISGYGDSIDISSLPNDNYMIVITSSYNNVFEGTFTTN